MTAGGQAQRALRRRPRNLPGAPTQAPGRRAHPKRRPADGQVAHVAGQERRRIRPSPGSRASSGAARLTGSSRSAWGSASGRPFPELSVGGRHIPPSGDPCGWARKSATAALNSGAAGAVPWSPGTMASVPCGRAETRSPADRARSSSLPITTSTGTWMRLTSSARVATSVPRHARSRPIARGIRR